jgi:hypothetical protein
MAVPTWWINQWASAKPVLTVRHGFSMALIEIDGLPFCKKIREDFPWRTVSHNQMVMRYNEL